MITDLNLATSNGILLSHPTGNANVRAALVGLLEAGILRRFHTTIATYPGNIWNYFGNEFQRRTFDQRLRPLTVQHPLREIGRMVAHRLNLSRLTCHETGLLSIDAIYQAQDRAVAAHLRNHPATYRGVYTYEDGALHTLQAAKDTQTLRIYDLPIAYWKTLRQLLAEEAERMPAWKASLGGGISDSEIKLERKTQELELAEVVICPSQFVAHSLPEAAQQDKTIIVAPFGSPINSSPRNFSATLSKTHKLRILFAGSMSQRKGLGDLFAAMKLLKRNDVELVVMGNLQAPLAFYRNQYSGFIYEPGRSHPEVLKLMRSCDALCLPSIVEGRALVMQEALSQGLPLIITPNTGGEDLIDEGSTGFLIPIRSAEKIAERISWLADHRQSLEEMSLASQAKARQLTWSNYGQTIAKAVCN